jgi:nanoRNase/pAp phosphatase (c-di-AMP/oligoRNAs hydrolase)
MVVLLDAGEPRPVGRLGKAIAEFDGMTAVIDHHEGVSWGDHRVVYQAACSTTTLILLRQGDPDRSRPPFTSSG